VIYNPKGLFVPTLVQICQIGEEAEELLEGGANVPCALVEWYVPIDGVDEDTGMWVVTPEFE
jgi:hypothetical protein